MQTWLKTIVLSFLIGSAYWVTSPIVYADVIKLENGVEMKVVIVSESATEVVCYSATGKLTLPRFKIESITKSSDSDNRLLRKKWREERLEKKKKLTKKVVSAVQEKKGEKDVIRYKSRWLTEEEYKQLREELRAQKEARLKEEKERYQDLIFQKEQEQFKQETMEAIIQGERQRSRLGNKVLASGDWLMKKNAAFRIFYSEKEMMPLAENIAALSERVLTKIIKDLSLPMTFYFRKKIELFLITDDDTWQDIRNTVSQAETPHACSLQYYKELFLDATRDEDDIYHIFTHEFGHLFLKEYTTQMFSKKHYMPLWLAEGFAGLQAPLPDHIFDKEELTTAINKNYYIKLADLLAMHAYPTNKNKKHLFYTESISFVEYIFERYGLVKFREFIDAVITQSYTYAPRETDINKKLAINTMTAVIKESFLQTDFAGFSSLEEAWLRYATE